jgi:DNA primase
MKRRFSPHQLSVLRNNIPIERVIVDFLSIHSRHDGGKLRFACPKCQSYDTSIHISSNQAKCFSCQHNFNTIEIVMAHLKISFVDGVKWLMQRSTEMDDTNRTVNNGQATPSKIGDILSEILPALPSKKVTEFYPETILEQIANLERRVDRLYLLIERFGSSVSSR